MPQPQKMVKHTQTIRQQQLTNCLSVFGCFVGSGLKGIRSIELVHCARLLIKGP